MVYAIIQVSNGSYSIVAEGITNLDSAKVQWHNVCAALWNAPDVQSACVMIADQNLDAVEEYKECIKHPTAV